MESKKTFSYKSVSDLWPDGHFEPSKGKIPKYMDTERHSFMEDISLFSFPYKRDHNSVKLENDNQILSDFFAYGSDYGDKGWKFEEFLCQSLQKLVCDKQIAFEIYVSEEDGNRLRRFPASSLRFSLIKGKYYQQIPKNIDIPRTSAFFCDIPESGKKYFNENDFFIMNTPKTLLKALPKIAGRSRVLQDVFSAEKFIKCQNLNLPAEILMEEQHLLRHRMFKSVGRSKLDKQENMTEYYYLLRMLRFAKFCALVREEFLTELNRSLEKVCVKLNQPLNKFIINGLISSVEYGKIESKLINQEISFSEVVNKVLNTL